MLSSIVIAGAGHAAGQTVISLRQGGYAGRIVMVGEEPYPPYQRPPLSKKFLAGELEAERLYLRPEKFYSEHAVELRLGTRVETIDRAQRRVSLSDGETLDYERLVLATGSHVRRLNMPGADLPGVHYLRTIDDVLGIREQFRPGARLIILGAGYIGLEVAAVAAQAGLDVMIREVADRVMARVASPEVSDFYAHVHRESGVDLRLGVPAQGSRIESRDGILALVDGHGQSWPADLIVVGVGVLPGTDLAEAAGLACNNGILVDEYCQTSDPNILAIGDCSNHPNRLLGCNLRLESVHNAQEQAKTAAATLLGKPEAYAQVPWFWSDQYDLKLQIVGIAGTHDQTVLRGDPAERSFSVFYLQAGRVIAVEAVNSAREFMLAKKLIAAGAILNPADIANIQIPFKETAEAALN